MRIFLLLILQLNLASAQVVTPNNLDALIAQAIVLSEEALYDARLEEAKKIVQISYFENFVGFNSKHEMMLTIQDVRVEGFMGILYQRKPDHPHNFKRLNNLLPHAQKMGDKDVQGNYFLAFSNAHRSIGNIDSVLVYEEKALAIFKEIGKLEKAAEIQAQQISRMHNQFFKDGEKEKILELIPKYETEIKFAIMHSKYALAYHTRHLAQIHRRQTLNYEAALSLFKTSLSLREEIGFKPFLPASYSSVGDVYVKMGDYEAAIESYTKSSTLGEEIGFVRYQYYPILSIGDIYLSQGNKEKAREYYNKALKSASKNNYKRGIDEVSEKLTQFQNESSPSLRNQPTIAYHEKENSIFLFGGYCSVQKRRLNDLWEFDGKKWKGILVNNPPQPRSGHTMLYDSLKDRLLVFGGKNEAGELLNDLWSWDDNRWELIAENGPPPRQSHRMVFNSDTGDAFLFGGSDAEKKSLNDTWLFSGEKWIKLSSDVSPPARLQHGMTYDQQRKKIILFGGFDRREEGKVIYGDTWEWDAMGKWKLKDDNELMARDHHAMAYDLKSKSTILFGGYNQTYLGDTWSWNGEKWKLLAVDGPSKRAGKPGLLYSPLDECLILFGGWDKNNKSLEDFWRFDGNTMLWSAYIAKQSNVQIQELLEDYYQTMSDRNWKRYKEFFSDEASLTTVWQKEGDSIPKILTTSISDFILQTKDGPDSQPIFEEKMINNEITVKNNLATAWVNYEAKFGTSDELMEWKGVDLFSFIKYDYEWKIISIVFESE